MEKIDKYIENFFRSTKRNIRYSMTLGQCNNAMNAIRNSDSGGLFIVNKIFDFGYAKGYRAAMAEMKKGRAA